MFCLGLRVYSPHVTMSSLSVIANVYVYSKHSGFGKRSVGLESTFRCQPVSRVQLA